jgi:phage-related protein
MEHRAPILQVRFYKTDNETEPVREWLKGQEQEDKKQIGEDIKAVQYEWPLGMPLIRKIEKELWEVRSRIQNGIARVFFTVDGNFMVLLHGFVKKSQATPQGDLDTARRRMRRHYGE